MKTTIIDADILKHEGKGAIFLRRFFYFFKKKQQGTKGEKHRRRHLKMFGEQGLLEIKKKIIIGRLGENLGNFLEKYI